MSFCIWPYYGETNREALFCGRSPNVHHYTTTSLQGKTARIVSAGRAPGACPEKFGLERPTHLDVIKSISLEVYAQPMHGFFRPRPSVDSLRLSVCHQVDELSHVLARGPTSLMITVQEGPIQVNSEEGI